MAKKKVFISFDYDSDSDLKGSLLAEAKNTDSPFAMVDFSLQESQPQHLWLDKAQGAIAHSDLFIVLLGNNTHQAPGVLKEVAVAKGLRKERFQLKPRRRNPMPVKDAGDVVAWKWKNLARRFS